MPALLNLGATARVQCASCSQTLARGALNPIEPQISVTGFWPDPFFLVRTYCFFEMYKSYRSNNYFSHNFFLLIFKTNR